MKHASPVTSPDCDVSIIGGGHNGLVCATYLAKAGLKVVVLEKNDVVGGAAVTEEFHPGFRNSVASYTVSLLNPKVISDLALHEYGLEIRERPVANFWPTLDGAGLVMGHDLASRQRAVAVYSERDAAMLPAYGEALDGAARLLRDLVLQTPPNAGNGIRDLIQTAGLGRRILREDLESQRTLAALFTKSAIDFLDQWFESDMVKGAFAFDGIVGAFAPPTAPGTAYVLLHHCFGEVNGKPGVWGHAVGGMGAITQAMAKAALAAGVEIRTSSRVARIECDDDRASAVLLASGARVSARAMAVNVPPKLLFRDLVLDKDTNPQIQRRFTTIKSGSGTFRMNVALSELPDFTCRPGSRQQGHHGAGIIIGPGAQYLERAYLDARQGGWSKEPIIEMLIPSTIDDTLAPSGQHVASLFVQHVAPHLPAPRSWRDPLEKERFADLVINTVNKYAPNFRASILARQTLSPRDLEDRFGLVDGDIFHGQLGLDQLFSLRPILGHADYRLPLKGLYLCGSGAHPGGGVTGAPGHNAAREMIRDFRRRAV
ncbi:MAG: phytoene desaturase family protein [Hyphomicrobiaceae bacterium]